jgi:hypothetical protein
MTVCSYFLRAGSRPCSADGRPARRKVCDRVDKRSSGLLRVASMSHTITIRLTDDLKAWVEETARRTGVPAGRIIRQQLERAKAEAGTQQFLRHAGKMSGPRDLSSRKGFAQR